MKTKNFFIFSILLLPLHSSATINTHVTAPTTDFSQPEERERFPGGATSHTKRINKDVFSQASANMSFERELSFKIGNGFFKRLWVSAPASTQAADGLGPVYNARSCQRCHLKDGRGHPPEGDDDNAVSMFLRLSIPPQNDIDRQLLASARSSVIPEPVYGTQLQDFSVAGIKAEGKMHIDYEEIPVVFRDGRKVSLRKPTYSIRKPAYGDPHPQLMISPRVAPQMIGLGLLQAIDEQDILALADPQDRNNDGISGKPNRVWSREHEKPALGRFGWKAGEVSINEQTQAAFAGDIGISVPLHPSGAGECTDRQTDCLKAPDGNSPQYENLEANQEIIDLVVFYSSNLSVPVRRDHDDRDVLRGKRIFYETGCISCHNPKFATGKDSVNLEQSEQLIWPYTDMLLHDMGPGLADNRPEGQADGNEWRTAPLWGIGLTPVVNGHSQYLHDGRARNILEAILWHGGEAQQQRDAVLQMSQEETDLLIRFIESL